MIHEILPVGMLECNCSIFGDEQTHEAMVIDPGDEVEEILILLAKHGLRVKAIVITHAHIDHIGGAAKLRQVTGAPVYMNENDTALRDQLDIQAAWLGVETPERTEIIGRSIDPYERTYGATMPALAGLVTRALMSRHGVGAREIAQVAVKNHANATRNPFAHFRQAVTLDEVLSSRMVADPLRLMHCCPISDGAAAVVLCSDPSPVRVAGVGQGADTLALRHRRELTSFLATRTAAREAYAMAGMGPERVDVAEIHDAFAPFELISLEDLGLVPPGKAGRATLDGDTALDGRLPINPSGGLKARGHPLAATGLAQIAECVWQLTGRAHDRQIPGVHCALAHSIGGLATNNWVIVLEGA